MNIDPRKYFTRSNILNKKILENDEKTILKLKNHKIKNYEFLKTIEKIKDKNIFIFDPSSVLCDKLNCFSIKENKILYRDRSHISKKNSFILYNQLYDFLIIN